MVFLEEEGICAPLTPVLEEVLRGNCATAVGGIDAPATQQYKMSSTCSTAQ